MRSIWKSAENQIGDLATLKCHVSGEPPAKDLDYA